MASNSVEAPVAAKIEQISPTLTREYLYDGRIVVFKVTSISRQTIDLWAEIVREAVVSWTPDHWYLALHDYSEGNISLTPYARAKGTELFNLRPDIRGSIAFVLRKTFIAQVMHLYLRSQRHDYYQNQIFFSRTEGLSWLVARMNTPWVKER